MEAVEFNRLLDDFEDLGIKVAGVSVDTDREIGRGFGTLKNGSPGAPERDTVLISTDGVILLGYQRVRAKGHAAEVLAAARRLREEGLV